MMITRWAPDVIYAIAQSGKVRSVRKVCLVWQSIVSRLSLQQPFVHVAYAENALVPEYVNARADLPALPVTSAPVAFLVLTVINV